MSEEQDIEAQDELLRWCCGSDDWLAKKHIAQSMRRWQDDPGTIIGTEVNAYEILWVWEGGVVRCTQAVFRMLNRLRKDQMLPWNFCTLCLVPTANPNEGPIDYLIAKIEES